MFNQALDIVGIKGECYFFFRFLFAFYFVFLGRSKECAAKSSDLKKTLSGGSIYIGVGGMDSRYWKVLVIVRYMVTTNVPCKIYSIAISSDPSL